MCPASYTYTQLVSQVNRAPKPYRSRIPVSFQYSTFNFYARDDTVHSPVRMGVEPVTESHSSIPQGQIGFDTRQRCRRVASSRGRLDISRYGDLRPPSFTLPRARQISNSMWLRPTLWDSPSSLPVYSASRISSGPRRIFRSCPP